MLALAPSVSRALAFAAGEGRWGEICTAQGARLVSLEERGDTAPLASASMDHCPFCMFGAGDGAAPLPGHAAALTPRVATDAPPRLFLLSPRPLFAWRSAQPRAPPAAP
ncbi:MAG: DUF2946 family protein [Rubrivivax sp.]|nr:DUF2946 family protein [Rubrivivax sp.]